MPGIATGDNFSLVAQVQEPDAIFARWTGHVVAPRLNCMRDGRINGETIVGWRRGSKLHGSSDQIWRRLLGWLKKIKDCWGGSIAFELVLYCRATVRY